MKVFVTGSTGLLGNNLVRVLEAAGAAAHEAVESGKVMGNVVVDLG
jgi:nucleoside-diphosphate-sugar epimerase